MIGVFVAKKNVSAAFDALNRRDVPAFLSDWREDCAFIYHGNIPVSGKMEGKNSIEKWFQNFMELCPKMKFTLKDICVENIFDLVGTNVITAHWDIDLTNRYGDVVHNSGVTIINIKFGKAFLVTDYMYASGNKHKIERGVA
jgi:ketosteroid isomerase-like protein